MGSFAPRRVITMNAAVTPPAPYKIEDNAYSLLDKTDLVFIDPVGNGFQSRRWQSAKQGFLGCRFRCEVTGAVCRDLHYAHEPLEFSKISDWRKLRHLSLCRACQLSARSKECLSEWNRSDLFGCWISARFRFIIRARTALTSITCPATPQTAWYHKMLKDRPDDVNAFNRRGAKVRNRRFISRAEQRWQTFGQRKSRHREKNGALYRTQRRLPGQGESTR